MGKGGYGRRRKDVEGLQLERIFADKAAQIYFFPLRSLVRSCRREGLQTTLEGSQMLSGS